MSSSTPAPGSAPRSVGFRSERGPILIALMLTTELVAIESTILATAVPSIVKDLGDFNQFLWLFSIYLLAWSMPALIAFRALQGLGAGAVQPMAVTIACDIYTVAERARVQGYLVSVWAISAVVGPTLGGFFSQLLSWRWIFYVNVPLCPGSARCLTRLNVSNRYCATYPPSTRW